MKKILVISLIALTCASFSFAAKKAMKTVAAKSAVVATANVKVEKKVLVKKAHKKVAKAAPAATTAPVKK